MVSPVNLFQPQFQHPSGLMGILAGKCMAHANRSLAEWTLSLLFLRPDDRVLEIGFGPGIAIQLASERIESGRISGIDPSSEMVHQALRRNQDGIQKGCVNLIQGFVENLPFPDEAFNKAFSINTVPIWDDVGRGLNEIHRVLKPGGVLVLSVQPHSTNNERDHKNLIIDMEKQVRRAGFANVRNQITTMKSTNAFCVLSQKK